MLTNETRAEIDRLDALATPGPWEFWSGSVMQSGRMILQCPLRYHADAKGECETCANAELAILARTALADCLKELREAERKLAAFGAITPCPNCDGSGKNAQGDCCRIPGHAHECACLLCQWKTACYRNERDRDAANVFARESNERAERAIALGLRNATAARELADIKAVLNATWGALELGRVALESAGWDDVKHCQDAEEACYDWCPRCRIQVALKAIADLKASAPTCSLCGHDRHDGKCPHTEKRDRDRIASCQCHMTTSQPAATLLDQQDEAEAIR